MLYTIQKGKPKQKQQQHTFIFLANSSPFLASSLEISALREMLVAFSPV